MACSVDILFPSIPSKNWRKQLPLFFNARGLAQEALSACTAGVTESLYQMALQELMLSRESGPPKDVLTKNQYQIFFAKMALLNK